MTTGYPNRCFTLNAVGVTSLTLAATLAIGCTPVATQDRYQPACNSRVYLQFVLPEYLSSRFPKYAPVRLGIIPFSAPANLSYRSSEFAGLGSELAIELQRTLIASGTVPIVEVFNRIDWPGKYEEFNTGNHQAIAYAREAGYDLVLIGLIEHPTALNQVAAAVRLIEVESGTTVFIGRSSVQSRSEPSWIDQANLRLKPSPHVPARVHDNALLSDLAGCITAGLLSDNPVP